MLYILSVVYDKQIKDSKIFEYKSEDVRHILFDNSEDPVLISKNTEFAWKHDCIYYGFGYNCGLSKAYNLVIKENLKDGDFLMILDDDTSLDDSYVSLVLNRIRQSDSLVFSPININGRDNSIDSPKVFGDSRMLKSHSILLHDKDKELYNSINNGTVVSKKAYDIIGPYDEDLFVYFTDAYFYAMLYIHDIKTEIIDVRNICDFSIRSTDHRKIVHRLKIIKKDGYHFYRTIYKKMGRPLLGKMHYHLFFFKKAIECSRQTCFLHFFSYLFTIKAK